MKHPPPYRRPNMEFEFDAWVVISVPSTIGACDRRGHNPVRIPTRKSPGSVPDLQLCGSGRVLQMNVTNLRLVNAVMRKTSTS